jgi:ParB-like chromosome segregation protein Spo0J
MNKHCQIAKTAIEVAETTDAKMAAYKWAAEEIEKAIDQDGLTQRQVAEQIGKNQSYVQRLLKALMRTRITKSDFYVDWQSGSNRRADIATTVPKKLADQVKMAAELLARPHVADQIVRSRTSASSNVQQAVSKKNAEDRDAFMRMAERRRQHQAVPIRGYHARIIQKLQEWAGEIVAIEPDLVESRDAFLAHGISVALRDLASQCARIADRIDQDTDAAVEGKARLRDR